ncbi:unnamed protein product, partial [Closterium sp. NIES-53]
MGTPGYVDPAYFSTCKATTASDVYSLGVLMLVVFMGRPPFVEAGEGGQLVTKWASACLSSGNLGSLTDPTMDAPADAVLRVAQISLTCTMERTAARPSMAHIANELQSIREEVVGKEELSAAVKRACDADGNCHVADDHLLACDADRVERERCVRRDKMRFGGARDGFDSRQPAVSGADGAMY